MMITVHSTTRPRQFDLDRTAIPKELQDVPRWIPWRAGPPKSSGKFSKVPIDPITGRNVNANDPKNWLSFGEACAAYDAGECSGIGIVLTDQPVSTWGGVLCGAHQYLVALDFDGCTNEGVKALKKLKRDLGGIYAEISPSGAGVRMLALSRQPLIGGNAGGGRELYGSGRFMTITGVHGHGGLADATEKLIELEMQWFPPKTKAKPALTLIPGSKPEGREISAAATALAGYREETPADVERVKTQLECINADCTYERWRNVVWSVLSTQWECAVDLAREWSQSAPNRYDEKAFEDVVASFDATRGITLGTLDHHAREGGWQPARAAIDCTADQHTNGEKKQGQRLLTSADIKALPALRWLIRNLLPVTGIASIYGPSGSGKSFLGLDIAFALAVGLSHWFGLPVKFASVAFVALEGEGGIKQRLAALETHYKMPAPDNLRFVLGNFTLIDSADVSTLAYEIMRTLGAGAVVFIDTLNQSAPGADENSSVEMGRIITNAKALADAVQGLVVLVHHAGKDLGRGMRGHSSLHAAMDAVIEVISNAAGRSWKVAKSKDGVSGVAHSFELVPYTVGHDADGHDITSCAIRPAFPTPASQLKPIVGKHQKVAHAILVGLASQYTDGIPVTVALTAVGQALDCDDRHRSDRATAAIKGLTDSGHLIQTDGVVTFKEP